MATERRPGGSLGGIPESRMTDILVRGLQMRTRAIPCEQCHERRAEVLRLTERGDQSVARSVCLVCDR